MSKRVLYLILPVFLLGLLPVTAGAAGTEAGVIQICDRSFSPEEGFSFCGVLMGSETKDGRIIPTGPGTHLPFDRLNTTDPSLVSNPLSSWPRVPGFVPKGKACLAL